MKEKLLQYLLNIYADKDSEGQLGQYTKMMAMYQLLTCLSAINQINNNNIDQNKIIEFIKQCQHEDGFSAYYNADSHILYTYNALQCLVILQKIDDVISKQQAHKLSQFIKTLFIEDRGFKGDTHWNTVDTRYMMSAIGSLFILSNHFQDDSMFIDQNMSIKIYNLIVKLFNYDGLASPELNYESHAMNVYMNICTLKLINKLDYFKENEKQIYFNIKTALMMRQTETGGFNGRPEKLPDACYSQWCGMTCKILNIQFNYEQLNQFLLACQDKSGGFADRPGDQSDIFHTCYSVSWLSTQQQFQMNEIDPIFDIPKNQTQYLWNNNSNKVINTQFD